MASSVSLNATGLKSDQSIWPSGNYALFSVLLDRVHVKERCSFDMDRAMSGLKFALTVLERHIPRGATAVPGQKKRSNKGEARNKELSKPHKAWCEQYRTTRYIILKVLSSQPQLFLFLNSISPSH